MTPEEHLEIEVMKAQIRALVRIVTTLSIAVYDNSIDKALRGAISKQMEAVEWAGQEEIEAFENPK